MNKDVVIIEKHLNNNEHLRMHYSEFVKEATIKITRKSAPNLKWNVQATYKVDLSYEAFKEVALKFVFAKNTNTDEIVEFIEKQIQKMRSEDTECQK